MTDDKFVSRLWQYISENMAGRTSGEMMLAQLDDLGHRLDTVYGMTCKGVHADISEFEANQSVIQTYLLIGDLLRLNDNDSGVFQMKD